MGCHIANTRTCLSATEVALNTLPRPSGAFGIRHLERVALLRPLLVTESSVTVIWSNAGGDPVRIHLTSPVQHHRNCEAAAEQPQSQRREGSAARLRADAEPGSRVAAPPRLNLPSTPLVSVKGDTSVGRLSAEGREIVSEGPTAFGREPGVGSLFIHPVILFSWIRPLMARVGPVGGAWEWRSERCKCK